MGAIYNTLLRLFLTDERLSEVGLTNAVVKNWITEEEKLAIIASKPVEILPPEPVLDEQIV